MIKFLLNDILARQMPARRHVVQFALVFAAAFSTVPAGSAGSSEHPQNSRQMPGEIHAQAPQLCGGVSPTGKIVYFPCDTPPPLLCSAITASGEIIYFVCHDDKEDGAKN